MKNPSIKKCILPCTPKTTCMDILTGIWLGIGRPVREQLSRKGLEQWFNGNVMTHLGDYRDAVRSRISLWRIVGMPPIWHVIA